MKLKECHIMTSEIDLINFIRMFWFFFNPISQDEEIFDILFYGPIYWTLGRREKPDLRRATRSRYGPIEVNIFIRIPCIMMNIFKNRKCFKNQNETLFNLIICLKLNTFRLVKKRNVNTLEQGRVTEFELDYCNRSRC